MNKNFLKDLSIKMLCSLALVLLVFGSSIKQYAQTASGTDIKNTASATYSDGTTDYNAVSNEVTVTVARVAGLTVTPDGQPGPSVVPGQLNVEYDFTVSNTGNFDDTVNLLANYASATVTGPATIADILVNGTSIGNGASTFNLTRAGSGAGSSATVTVVLNIDTTASPGSSIQVFLGDTSTNSPTFDNEPYTTTSGNEHSVYTTSTGAVNGQREARGDLTSTVANDAIPEVTLTGPAGPITPGTNISYSSEACNIGNRDLVNPYFVIPLPNLPTPAETLFAGFTGASAVYNTTGFEYSADGVTWTPGTFATLPTTNVNYVRAALTPNPLVPGAANCQTITYDVRVPETYNATTPVSATVILTGTNSVGSPVSDTSGVGVNGTPVVTPVAKIGGTLLGPNGQPGANGPTDNNDDFTERVGVVTPAVAPGTPVASPPTVTFNNTLSNSGNADDTFTITAPVVPPGSTVRVSFDNGATWTTIVGPGATTATSPEVVRDATLNIQVEVTLPPNTPSGAAYPTTITATSVNDPTSSNSTIDTVLLGGFINLNKTALCVTAGTTTASDCIPGAEIIYTVTYTNFSASLTANNLVITEDGNAGDNNWGANTTRVTGQEFDYAGTSGTTAGGGTVNVVSPTVYTDTISTLAPQTSGRFVFRRVIN